MYLKLPEEQKSILDLKFVDVFWLACFVLLLFGSSIQAMTGFAYIDEAVTCCVVVAAIARAVRAWSKKELYVRNLAILAVFSIVSLAILGVYCNLRWGYNSSKFDIIVDMFTCLKFPATLLCSIFIFKDASRDIFFYMEKICKALICTLFVLAVANLFFDFGMGADSRYGVRASFEFICGHPTYLVMMCVGIILTLSVNARSNLAYIVLALLVTASSLRSKGLVFCVVAAAILFVMRGGRRLNAIHIFICVLAAIAIGWEQFTGYYQADGTARTELTRASVEIASDYFPFGTGFATFGSPSSAKGSYYSPVYQLYELDTVWGITQGDTRFLSDTFWPIVLGQFGVLGFAIYVTILLSTALVAFREANGSKVPVVLCFAYLLISSTSESSFFNPMSVYLALTLGIIIGACSSRVDSNPVSSVVGEGED